MREPTKVLACFFSRLGDDRHLQAPADHLRDLSKRYTLFCDRVVAGSSRSLLKRQPVEMRGIEPVHRWPAVTSVADIRRDTFLTGHIDHVADEALLDRIV